MASTVELATIIAFLIAVGYKVATGLLTDASRRVITRAWDQFLATPLGHWLLANRLGRVFAPDDFDPRAFTGSSVEEELLSVFEDMNPHHETEIVRADYAFESGGVIFLDYVSDSRGRIEVREEVDHFAHVFRSVVSRFDYPIAEMTVDILDESEISVASYHVKRDWVDAYLEGEINHPEYIRRIIETFESPYDEFEWA